MVDHSRDAEAALASVVDDAVAAQAEWAEHGPSLATPTFRDHLLHRLGSTAAAYSLYDMTQAYRLIDFVDWLIALDDPGSEDRKTITLTAIIERAREARPSTATNQPRNRTEDR